MYKDFIKTMLILFIISAYLTNLLVMFTIEPIDILIGNIFLWCIYIIIFSIVIFIFWLNDK